LKLLEPFRDKLPPEVFTQEFKLPITNGSGQDRKVLAEADKLLKEAGWIVKDGKRVNAKTGEPLAFEFLLADPAYERVALALQRNLAPLGIVLTPRTVTPSQYIEKVQNYDYDMIAQVYPGTDVPGNEQREYWSSKSADTKNGYNFSGLKDPVVDQLIELVVSSPDKASLLDRTHALDRVLSWQFVGIPEYYQKVNHLAYWNKFGQPKLTPRDGIGLSTWWIDPTLAAKAGK
jgi:microcin C transport system substrate-binding protein